MHRRGPRVHLRVSGGIPRGRVWTKYVCCRSGAAFHPRKRLRTPSTIGNSSGNFRAQRVGNPEPTLGHVCIYFCGSGTRPLVSYSLPRNRPLCLAFGIVRPPQILLVCRRIHVTKKIGGPINESKPTPNGFTSFFNIQTFHCFQQVSSGGAGRRSNEEDVAVLHFQIRIVVVLFNSLQYLRPTFLPWTEFLGNILKLGLHLTYFQEVVNAIYRPITYLRY